MATTLVREAPSLETFLPPSSPLPGWAFPGPSSRYHSREKSKAHCRHNSSVSQPITPLNNTERRVHTRAQSSYAIPSWNEHDRSRAAQRFYSAHSRRSQHVSSPIEHRNSLRRFSSFDSSRFANKDSQNSFTTPVKSPTMSRKHSMAQQSPYSDYFTDDSRSIDEAAGSLSEAETQQLLVKLNKLQSALMRGGNDSQALHIVGRRMEEIEQEMDALHSQSRQPPELDDSGLFLEEAHEADTQEGAQDIAVEQADKQQQHSHEIGRAHSADSLVNKQRVIAQLEDMVRPMMKLNVELQQRLSEVRNHNTEMSRSLEVKDAAVRELQVSMEAMRMDREHSLVGLIRCRSLLIQVVNHIKVLRIPDVRDLIASLRELAKGMHDTLQEVCSQQAAHRGAEQGQLDASCLRQQCWRLDTVKDEQGEIQTVTLERVQQNDPTPETNLLGYINAVEDILSNRQTSNYVEAGTQTESAPHQTLYDLDDGYLPRDNSRGSFDSWSADPTKRPTLVRPDNDDGQSCAITTSPCSEVDASERPSGLSRFLGAVSDFVDDHFQDEAATDEHDTRVAEATEIPPVIPTGAGDSKSFWGGLMEIAGFVDD